MLKEDTAKRKQIFKEIGFGFKSTHLHPQTWSHDPREKLASKSLAAGDRIMNFPRILKNKARVVNLMRCWEMICERIMHRGT